MIYWYCKDTSAYLPEIGQIRHFFKERNGNLTRRTVQEKLQKVLENPSVIKTPVVRNGKLSTLGYQPEIWKNWK